MDNAHQWGPVHYLRDPQTSFFSDFFIKNGSHDTIQYVLTLKTYQLEVSTFMIKTNHLSWYIIVFTNEMPIFIIDYELKLWVYKELVIYIFYD